MQSKLNGQGLTRQNLTFNKSDIKKRQKEKKKVYNENERKTFSHLLQS